VKFALLSPSVNFTGWRFVGFVGFVGFVEFVEFVGFFDSMFDVDALVKSHISDGFVKKPRSRLANPEE